MTSTMKISTLLAVAFACAMIGCGSGKHTGSGRVHVSKKGFSIVPPQGWESKGEFMGNFMTYMGPVEGEFQVNFNANVNPHDGTPMEKVHAQFEQVLPKVLTDYAVADKGFATIDGRKVAWISGTFRMGAGRLRNLQYVLLSGNGKKVYVMTFTAPADTFDKHEALFEQTALTARTD